MQEWRRKRRASELLRKAKSRPRTRPAPSRTPTTTTPRSSDAGPPNFKVDRLRAFQTWYRTEALPCQRNFQDSPDLIRSMRLPLTCPSAYISALVAYWWLEDCGRDAIGWLLTDAEPNWTEMRKLLSLAQTVSCQGPRRGSAPRFRRGVGAVPAGTCAKRLRQYLSVQRWHNAIKENETIQTIARTRPKMTTSYAAAALATVHGIGPYLAKNVINTLLSHDLLVFDQGIVGPGALASLSWLRGGTGAVRSQGLWPMATGADAVAARDAISHLANLESCHWLDIQHALCLWRSFAPFKGKGGTCPRRPESAF